MVNAWQVAVLITPYDYGMCRVVCDAVLQGHSGEVWGTCFSHDGQLLVSVSDETIQLWDIQTKRCVGVFRSVRPYERTNIIGVTGLTHAQIANLKALGAVEKPREDELAD